MVTALAPNEANSNMSGDGGDWWSGTLEEDAVGGLRLDEAGLWSGSFVPPPPRPLFLDESATPDGLTTCDLCAWAWQEGKTFTLDAALGECYQKQNMHAFCINYQAWWNALVGVRARSVVM